MLEALLKDKPGRSPTIWSSGFRVEGLGLGDPLEAGDAKQTFRKCGTLDPPVHT